MEQSPLMRQNTRMTGWAVEKHLGKWRKAGLILAGCLGLACLPASQAAIITLGSWSSTDGETVTGANTDDPSFSPITGAGAGGGIYAPFNASLSWASLAVGDTLTLGGSFTVAGTATTAQAFRFGLWDSNGSASILGWSGYVVVSQNSSTSMIFERSTLTNDFSTTSAGTGNFIGTGTWGGQSIGNGDYSFQQIITKTASGLSMSVSVQGINGTTYSMTGSATDNSMPGTLDQFNRAGFVFSGAYSADSVQFTDITVTTTAAVPEPSAWTLLVAGGAALLACRTQIRRKQAAGVQP
jgi:hypothetical protein